MKDVLSYIVENILPETEFSVDEKEEDGLIHLTISVPKEQMGKVIGKNGKIINAMKNVLKIKAVKENKKLDIQVVEQTRA